MGARTPRSVLDRRPLTYDIEATQDGQVWYPTPGVTTIQAAYLPGALDDPSPTDWVDGVFETTPIGSVVGLVMVGPGGTKQLGIGTWYEWVKIDDPATGAQPVQMVGTVTIV